MLIQLLLAGALLGVFNVAADAPTCDLTTLQALGFCPSGTNTGSKIIIDGSQHSAGDPVQERTGDSDWSVDDGWAPPREEFLPAHPDLPTCMDWKSAPRCFLPREEPEEKSESFDVVLPTVTITDVARFAPTGSTVRGEPDNLGVAGLPTNFITSATTHTESGALFGHPVWVRFTPVGYDFDYGDGHTLTTKSAGASWTTLDQAPFTPTDTSHTYQERGTYTTRVTVRYAAEIEFGTGWTPITGEVRSPGPTQDVRILEARTALVAHTCTTTPTSPGC